jgi:AbiTii
MRRQEEALKLADELLADIELERCTTEQCLLKARRLARLTGNSEWDDFVRFELNGYDGSEESLNFMDKTGRWTNKAEPQGKWMSLATLESFVTSQKSRLAQMTTPNLSGDYVNTAMSKHLNTQTAVVNAITENHAVISRVRAVLHDFISQAYFELAFSESQATLFEAARIDIDIRIGPLSNTALDKVDSIIDRLNSGNTEGVSQAMSTCRRLIDSIADSIYPPRDEPIELGGNTVKIGPQNYLNRINAYVAERVQSKGRRDRIRRSLSDIYERVSAGVHAEVSIDEAKYLFLHTYIVLGEVVMLTDATRT